MRILRGTNIYQHYWEVGQQKETAGVVVGTLGIDAAGDIWEMGALSSWLRRTTAGALNVSDASKEYIPFVAIAAGVTSQTLHTSTALEGRHRAAFFVDHFGTPGGVVHVYASMGTTGEFGFTELSLLDLRTGATINGTVGAAVAANALSKNYAVLGLAQVPVQHLIYQYTATTPGLCLLRGAHIRS